MQENSEPELNLLPAKGRHLVTDENSRSISHGYSILKPLLARQADGIDTNYHGAITDLGITQQYIHRK